MNIRLFSISLQGGTRGRRFDLINTPLQRGGARVAELFNRFNGFPCVCRAVRNVLGRALHFPQEVPKPAFLFYGSTTIG